jgi:hypothetical protein
MNLSAISDVKYHSMRNYEDRMEGEIDYEKGCYSKGGRGY